MSQNIADVLSLIYQGLIGLGAFASGWFFFDYIRTADITSPFSKMMLTLNAAMGVILTAWFIQNLVETNIWANLLVNIITLIAFVFVDAMLLLQIYLLHKTRDL